MMGRRFVRPKAITRIEENPEVPESSPSIKVKKKLVNKRVIN